MLMNLYRLSGRKVCERVKIKGHLWRGKHFHVRWLPGPPRSVAPDAPAGLYVGLVTSVKLHKSAVKRNRMRRRCREALRITLKEKMAQGRKAGGLSSMSVQLLILPRFSSLSAAFRELIADSTNFLSTL